MFYHVVFKHGFRSPPPPEAARSTRMRADGEAPCSKLPLNSPLSCYIYICYTYTRFMQF